MAAPSSESTLTVSVTLLAPSATVYVADENDRNSRNLAPAAGPASTITCGRTISCTFPDDFAG